LKSFSSPDILLSVVFSSLPARGELSYEGKFGIMGEFQNGDLVKTPSGRIAKVNRYWEESRRDCCARVDLTYADTGEPVRLSPSLLILHEGERPGRSRRERKERRDVSMESRQIVVQLNDVSIPKLNIVEQLLLMDGCMKAPIQGQAGGLASAKKRMLH
jgi:hypothetical protein